MHSQQLHLAEQLAERQPFCCGAGPRHSSNCCTEHRIRQVLATVAPLKLKHRVAFLAVLPPVQSTRNYQLLYQHAAALHHVYTRCICLRSRQIRAHRSCQQRGNQPSSVFCLFALVSRDNVPIVGIRRRRSSVQDEEMIRRKGSGHGHCHDLLHMCANT